MRLCEYYDHNSRSCSPYNGIKNNVLCNGRMSKCEFSWDIKVKMAGRKMIECYKREISALNEELSKIVNKFEMEE